ncbi:nuclease-related domain-containing protein [Piscinibacter sp.]|jgi:hypothetical protein|uniref:nuclease-related domain-containing protein n=1 Tax=Piscinibacter sp. TaxID=1903157 RepID=UPI0035599455
MKFDSELDESYRLPGIPERRKGEAQWSDRLDDWLALRKVPPRAESGQVRAGRTAELSLRARLGRHESTRFGEIFGGKRVPRAPGQRAGRYEIDLIVITPRRLHVIEVKNWSGRLSLDGAQWVHERSNGERLVHPNLATYNQAKAQTLSRYLVSHGTAVPSPRIAQTVVFTNQRLQTDRAIEEHPNIVTAQQLERYIRQQRGASRWAYAFSALIQACADADNACKLADGLFDLMPPLMVDGARAAIAELRTWDRLQLHGGRELIGDLLWIHNRDGRLAAEAFASATAYTLRWRRGMLGILPLMGWGSFGHMHDRQTGWRPVAVNDCVYFHEAGQAQPAVIALRAVDRIEIG